MEAPPLRVLLVDDDEDDYLLTRDMLREIEGMAHQLEWAASYEAGLAAIQRREHDVYLLDYQLGGRTGLELLRAITMEVGRSPGILLTGAGDHQIDVTAMEAGAADYLVKHELTPALLERSIRYAIDRARLSRKLDEALASAQTERERYQIVGELTSDFAYAYKVFPDGRVQSEWLSGAFARITGFTAEELEAAGGWDQLIHPGDKAVALERWHAMRSGRPYASEFRLIARDGRVHWLREYLRGHVSAVAGGWLGYGAAQEITEAKLAEQHVHFQAHLLDTVGQAVIATDLAGHIVYWNQAAEALYGWTSAEVLGGSIHNIVPSSLSSEEGAVIRAGVLAGEPWSGEYWVRHRDGRSFPVLVSDTPVYDESGVMVGVVGVSADISDRLAAEKALRASERFAHASLDALDQQIAVVNETGVIVAVNQAWRNFARDNGWLVDNPGVGDNYLAICDAAGDDDATRAANGIRDVLEGHVPSYQHEYPCHAPDHRRWFAMRVTRFAGDGPVRAAVAHLNITARELAEENLRLSEARFRALTERATDLVAVLDRAGIFRYASPSYEHVLGYDPRDIVGQPIFSAVHADDTARLRKLLARGYRSGKAVSAQFRIRHRNGAVRVMETVAVNQLADPAVQGMIVTSHDVTEREQYVETLREREAFWRAFIEDLPVGAMLFNPEGRILTANSASQRILNLSMDQLLGRSPIDPDWHMVDDNGRRVSPEALRTMVRSAAGRPVIDAALRIYHPDTREQVWVHGSAVPQHGDDGTLLAVICTFTDISARRRAEQDRDRFFALSQSLLGIASLDGHFVDVNAAFESTLGWAAAEICAEPFLHFVHPEDQAATIAEVEKLAAGELTISFENRYRCKDGSYKWLNWTATPFPEQHRLYCSARDVTADKLAAVEVRRHIDRLSALRQIDLAITSSHDVRIALNVLLQWAVRLLEVDAADVLVYNTDLQRLEFGADYGRADTPVRRTVLGLGQGLAGQAALERRLIEVPDLRRHEPRPIRGKEFAAEGFVTYFGVPLIAKGDVQGVLELFHRSPRVVDEDWREFLEALAGQAAIAIDNGHLYERLQRSNADLVLAYDNTIEGWSRALDLRDKETEGHSQRVTEMTLRLARASGTSDAELVHMRRGALLHDIGKMGVPDTILLKPGPLTDEEWVIMRGHPVYAYELLSPVNYLRLALDIPYCHHEKWDGSGYPRGLKGLQIPMSARIFAVVDVWDALRSDRPYRAGWPAERVREHIRTQAGTHFDPAVVTAFLGILAEEPDR